MYLQHLHGQLSRGNLILFTGAGFSCDARNIAGHPLPSASSLARSLWSICWPNEPFDERTQLQDVFEAALRSNRHELVRVLSRELAVAHDSVPDHLVYAFSLPWLRVYTLNVDNLADVINGHFQLPRKLNIVSATEPSDTKRSTSQTASLHVIHLNGVHNDIPDGITFGATQYGQRLAIPDPLYQLLVSDLVSRSVVFIGTRLEESPLWQSIEIRRAKGSRGERELRPRSYLITPDLDRARQARLEEFNIVWLPINVEQFTALLRGKLSDAIEQGMKILRAPTSDGIARTQIPLVEELAVRGDEGNEFLLGEEPVWADLQCGRAVEREVDRRFAEQLESELRAGERRVFVVSGTAGSGKSATLMRLALRRSAAGDAVGYVGRDSDLEVRDILDYAKRQSKPFLLFIDDADLYGTALANMLNVLADIASVRHVVIGMRTSHCERLLNPAILEPSRVSEEAMPELADEDIDVLIDTLEAHKREGALRGLPRTTQRRLFRNYAGRQLLVAMMSATSGRNFEDKIAEELNGLSGIERKMYAIVSVATSFRYMMSRQDVLVAAGVEDNRALNFLQHLIRRRLLVESKGPNVLVRARHRLVAETVRLRLEVSGEMEEPIEGLATAAAVHITAGTKRSAPPYRLLRAVISHEFLLRTLGLLKSRGLYQRLESYLEGDHHFWLQRGSMEVEKGDLRMAELYLNHARGIEPDDVFIDNEWAYLLFRRANESPESVSAAADIEDALALVRGIVSLRRGNPHTFTITGRQGVLWARRGLHTKRAKADFLGQVRDIVEIGRLRFPRNEFIRQVWDEVNGEYIRMGEAE